MLVVYTKNYCPYCVKAKNYLKLKNIEFREINIEEVPEAREFLKEKGHRTVPQIYQQDYTQPNAEVFVEGGCDGLMRLSLAELNERVSRLEKP